MAIRCMGSAVVDLSALGYGALNGVEVFADFTTDRDANASLFKCGAQAGKELAFQSGGELAEFHLAGGATLAPRERRPTGTRPTEFIQNIVAEADAGAGVVEADFAATL